MIRNLGINSRAIDLVARTDDRNLIFGDDLALIVIHGTLPIGVVPAKIALPIDTLYFPILDENGVPKYNGIYNGTYSISHPYGLEKSGGFLYLDKNLSSTDPNWYHFITQGTVARPGSSGSGLFSLRPTFNMPKEEFSGLHAVLSKGPSPQSPAFFQCTIAGEPSSKIKYVRLDRFRNLLEAHVGR